MKVKGAGHIEKRGKGSYRIRFCLGINSVTGKRKYTPWRSIHGTKADAQKALNEYRREIEGGLRLDLQDITFSEFAELFMQERRTLGVLSETTLKGDRWYVNHLNKYLDDVLLTDIDTLMLKDMFMQLLTEDGVSQTRLHDIVIKTKQILQEAVNAEILLRNPADKIKTPPRSKPKRNSLRDYEAGSLLKALDAMPLDRNTIAVYIGLATGMRRGEVLALQWNNIDFRSMHIDVTHSLDPYRRRIQPKTEAGYRRIFIDVHTTEKLKEWMSLQSTSLRQRGMKQSESTFVCSNRYGEACQPSRFYKWFKDFCVDNGFADYVDEDGRVLPKQQYDEFGVPVDENGRRYSRTNKKTRVKKHYRGLKFHELRHTHATLLIANGIDVKTVQNRLGHATSSMTLDFYAHAQEEQDRSATDLFSKILEGEN